MKKGENVIPVLYEHKQSIREMMEAHGYTSPSYRVSVVHNAKAMDGETLVARVKVGKHSLPLPIFRKEVVSDEEVNNGSA